MAHAEVRWHRPWVMATESVLVHMAAIIVGFVMMVVGVGLGVPVITLAMGIVICLIGMPVLVAQIRAD